MLKWLPTAITKKNCNTCIINRDKAFYKIGVYLMNYKIYFCYTRLKSCQMVFSSLYKLKLIDNWLCKLVKGTRSASNTENPKAFTLIIHNTQFTHN